MIARLKSVRTKRVRTPKMLASLVASAIIGSVSAVAISTAENTPVSAAPVLSCADDFLAADSAGNLLRVGSTTYALTTEFHTTQSTFMNGLASNTDPSAAPTPTLTPLM